MKFHYFVTITLPDAIFPPSPEAHPDDSPERTGRAMAEGLRRVIPRGGSVLPCIGGGTSWTVEQVQSQIGLTFDKAIAAGRPPIVVHAADATIAVPMGCRSCGHSAHYDRVCGFRPLPGLAACLCTAMDGMKPPKSARRWLKWDDLIPVAPPLQIVVWVVELAFSLFGVWNLLKMLWS